MSDKTKKKKRLMIITIILFFLAAMFIFMCIMLSINKQEVNTALSVDATNTKEYTATVQRTEVKKDRINIYLNDCIWYITIATKDKALRNKIKTLVSEEQIYYRIKHDELRMYPNFPDGVTRMEFVALRTENAELMSLVDYNQLKENDTKKLLIATIIVAILAFVGALICLFFCVKRKHEN